MSVTCGKAGRWFSLGTPISSINETDRHDITEILLRVALNIITPPYRYIHSTTYLTGSKPSLKNKLSKHKERNSKSNCNTFQYLHFITLISNVSSDNNNLVDSHEVKYTVQIIFTTNPEKKWCKSTCVFVFWYTVLHLSWQWVSTTISHIIVPYSKQKWYLYIYI